MLESTSSAKRWVCLPCVVSVSHGPPCAHAYTSRVLSATRAKAMVFTAAEMKMAKQEHSRVSRNINEFKEKCRALLKRNAGVIDAGDFKVW